MAKRKAISKPVNTPVAQAAEKPVSSAVLNEKPSSANMLYAVLFAVTLLVIVAIIISVRSSDDEDQITAWATVRSSELHTFMQGCRDNGGTADVRPNQAPVITFVCLYPDRSVEYVLQPGKK